MTTHCGFYIILFLKILFFTHTKYTEFTNLLLFQDSGDLNNWNFFRAMCSCRKQHSLIHLSLLACAALWVPSWFWAASQSALPEWAKYKRRGETTRPRFRSRGWALVRCGCGGGRLVGSWWGPWWLDERGRRNMSVETGVAACGMKAPSWCSLRDLWGKYSS